MNDSAGRSFETRINHARTVQEFGGVSEVKCFELLGLGEVLQISYDVLTFASIGRWVRGRQTRRGSVGGVLRVLIGSKHFNPHPHDRRRVLQAV